MPLKLTAAGFRYTLGFSPTDIESDNSQPLEPEWNVMGVANNAVQRVVVQVRPGVAV